MRKIVQNLLDHLLEKWAQFSTSITLAIGNSPLSHIFYAFREFDESRYLEQNPDVAEAVRNGDFPSAWEHYLIFGFDERRSGAPAKATKVLNELVESALTEPFPPEHLRKRVHGEENLLSFKRYGRAVSVNISLAINSIVRLNKQSCILDFGCGCGRVIRYLKQIFPNASFYGTDIDNEAILWCQEHLSKIGTFTRNEVSPPLPFEDGFFDFVYSISVFTHLPEDMQFAWLKELWRVTKPGAYLLLTVHSEYLLETTPNETEKFQEKGFYYGIGHGTEGLPDFYQTSYHTHAYIYKEWGKFFEITKIIGKGIVSYQDLVLCRKPSL